MKHFTCLLLLAITPQLVLADWGITGAATRCDKKGKAFVIAPVVELSSPDPGAIDVEPGFNRLHTGPNELSCRLGTSALRADIRVFGPSATGMSMGAGYVEIRLLQLGEKQIFDGPLPFNWDGSSPILMRVTVDFDTSNAPQIETCTAKSWEWGTGFKGVTCEQKPLR